MPEPGEQVPGGLPAATAAPRRRPLDVLRPRSLPVALLEAIIVGLLAAGAWALLRSILELSAGLLAVAAIGGWGVGAVLHQVRAGPLLAAILGATAGVAALVLAWLVAMAILPGSSRTFSERLAMTSFPDWLAPQVGPIEVLSIVIFSAAAAYAARRR